LERLTLDVQRQSETISILISKEARRTDQEEAREQMDALKEKHLDERLQRLEAAIEQVYSLGKWVLGAIGGAVLLAIVAFGLKGGFFVG
jgi:hypothetical protein